MSTEAEPPGLRLIPLRLGWPRLRLGLLVLVAVLGAVALNQAAETRRLRQEQSPSAQRDEWRRVQAQGLAVARFLKATPLRTAREAEQLLDTYWSGQPALRTPAALYRAGEDSQDLVEAAEMLRQAEWAEEDRARLAQAAQQEDENWRLSEHGLAARPPQSVPAPMRAAAALLPPSPFLSLRRVAWVKAVSAVRYRAQAQRAIARVIHRYDIGP